MFADRAATLSSPMRTALVIKPHRANQSEASAQQQILPALIGAAGVNLRHHNGRHPTPLRSSDENTPSEFRPCETKRSRSRSPLVAQTHPASGANDFGSMIQATVPNFSLDRC